jgi:hypothetical protein
MTFSVVLVVLVFASMFLVFSLTQLLIDSADTSVQNLFSMPEVSQGPEKLVDRVQEPLLNNI